MTLSVFTCCTVIAVRPCCAAWTLWFVAYVGAADTCVALLEENRHVIDFLQQELADLSSVTPHSHVSQDGLLHSSLH